MAPGSAISWQTLTHSSTVPGQPPHVDRPAGARFTTFAARWRRLPVRRACTRLDGGRGCGHEIGRRESGAAGEHAPAGAAARGSHLGCRTTQAYSIPARHRPPATTSGSTCNGDRRRRARPWRGRPTRPPRRRSTRRCTSSNTAPAADPASGHEEPVLSDETGASHWAIGDRDETVSGPRRHARRRSPRRVPGTRCGPDRAGLDVHWLGVFRPRLADGRVITAPVPVPGTFHQYCVRTIGAIGRPSDDWRETNVYRRVIGNEDGPAS